MPPLLGQVVQRLLAFTGDTAIVLELQPAVLADVAEVRGDCAHTAAATGHLDHHLRRAPDDRGPDVLANRRGALSHAGRQARRGRRPDDAVARIEEPLAPLDEDTIDIGARTH